MRVCQKNKQKMYYSLFNGSTPEYETDDEGNIVYTDVDGVQVPVKTGNIITSYSEPVEFFANITSELNELHMKAWGVDQSSIYSQIGVQKCYLPIEVGSVVWRENAIKWQDEENKIPLASSADYTVKGIMTEELDLDFFLLQRNTEEEGE